jgi:hypothetical protein
VDVQRVLHHALLAAQEDDVKRRVAGRWNHLKTKQLHLNKK